jgi:hypothetical protein
VNDPVTYLQLRKFFDQYACIKQMAYCNHPFDTQTNEPLNQVIATVAPKNVCYSGSGSLYSRIAMVIGIHNLGNELFFKQVLDQLAVFPDGLSQYLCCQDRKRERRRIYERKFDVKLKQGRQQKWTHDEVFHEHTDNSYGPGVGLTAGMKGNGTNKEKSVKEN